MPVAGGGQVKNPDLNDPCPCGSGRKYRRCCRKRRPLKDQVRASPSETGGEWGSVRALRDAGRFLEAARLAENLLALERSNPQANTEAGLVHLHAGSPDRALGFFREAVRLAPTTAICHYNFALALEMLGRDGEAISGFNRAVKLAPDDPAALTHLANLLLIYGQRRQAIGYFRRAAELTPDEIGGFLNRATAFMAEDASEEAAATLREAIARFPHSAEAHRVLAGILRQQGRFEEAIPLLEQATEGNAVEAATAYYDLANSKRITADDEPMLEQMRSLAQVAGLPRMYRSRVHFGLGKALDDLGRYKEAIHHFDAANRLAREGHPFDRAHFGQSVNRLITSFTADSLKEQAASGSASELPVFIVGMPRSGTTLVEQVISSHPGIAAGGELSFWNESTAAIAGRGGWDRAKLAQAGAEYQALLRQISPDALRVTDKQPGNFLWIGLIHSILPRARFIHCRRHPIDTCLSNYFTNFNSPLIFSFDKGDLAFYYRWYERLMAHWHDALPPGVLLDIQYEDMVTQPEQTARNMIAFTGLEWDDACLRHEKNRALIKTASLWQARQPTYRSSLDRWRNYQPWLGELRDLLNVSDGSVPPQPVSQDPRIPTARQAQEKGHLDEALSILQQALRNSPNDPVLYSDAGAVCLLSGQVELAADCFERAIGLCPHFATAHYNLAVSLERLGRPAEAIAKLRRAIDLMPTMGSAYSRLGNLLQSEGEEAAALDCFRRANELVGHQNP
jgi:tetratricopeptide (TPR) repeat protein